MRKNQLSGRQLKDFQNSYLAGYGYGLGVRTLLDPAAEEATVPRVNLVGPAVQGHGHLLIPVRAYLWFICIRWRPIGRDFIIYGSEPARTAVWIRNYK